jgi:hypothetical protein
MGRLSVRTAITEAFENANLQYVGKVHSARPEVIQEEDYERNRLGEAVESEAGSSAVLVVNLPSDDRKRRALTGRGAVNDTNVHHVLVEVFFASSGGEAVKAQEDYDTVIDAIVDFIRANPNMGNPSVVWSAGEYDAGVTHQQAAPYTDADGLTVFISGAVSFEAFEWIAGAV